MANYLRIGFLGAGKMASALAKGIVTAGVARSEDLMASDVVEGARTAFGKELGCKVTAWNVEVADFADVLIVAVKPDQVEGLLSELAAKVSEHHVIVSIAARRTALVRETVHESNGPNAGVWIQLMKRGSR